LINYTTSTLPVLYSIIITTTCNFLSRITIKSTLLIPQDSWEMGSYTYVQNQLHGHVRELPYSWEWRWFTVFINNSDVCDKADCLLWRKLWLSIGIVIAGAKKTLCHVIQSCCSTPKLPCLPANERLTCRWCRLCFVKLTIHLLSVTRSRIGGGISLLSISLHNVAINHRDFTVTLIYSYKKTCNVFIMHAFLYLLLQWKIKRYYIFWVCLCGLWYPACNTHEPYCHLWPVRLYDIFANCFINCTFKKERQRKVCFDFVGS
jgi:hypothetical protein